MALVAAFFFLGVAQLHAANFAFHAYTHETEQHAKVNGGAECSATAIGPHALLTASHCECATNKIVVDGVYAQIVGTLRDEEDHTIYLLTGITFQEWYAEPLPVDLPLSVGDEVLIFGNPVPFRDMLRHAYVSGTDGPGPSIMFLDGNIRNGDSGAGVFSPDGKLLGVVSVNAMAGNNIYAGIYPMKFTESQIKQAREF